MSQQQQQHHPQQDITPAPPATMSSSAHPQHLDHAHPSSSASDLAHDAALATDAEKNLTLWQGLKAYPKACAWSMLISSCIIMEGYDVVLINGLYAFPQFVRRYGTLQPDGTYAISAAWQSGLSNGYNVGEIIGLFLIGAMIDRFGYRKSLLFFLIWTAAFITLNFTAHSLVQLQVAAVLLGIAYGAFQTSVISYAADVAPVKLRGYLTCWVNSCWGIGQVVGVGVVKSLLGRTDQWAYRIPYAVQWVWIPGLVIGLIFAPESPWWLVRKGRIEEARRNVRNLMSAEHVAGAPSPDATVAMMRQTILVEEKMSAHASWLDCFRGVDLRRTEIVVMAWASQNLLGNAFTGYSTYFFEQAGVSASNSYSFALGQYAINVVGVFGAWALMSAGIGRRTLFLAGACGLCAILLIIGFLSLVPAAHYQSAAYGAAGCMIGWAVIYQLTVGSIVYSLVAELSSRRLAVKTVVIGRIFYNIVGIITSVLTPYMLNKTAWNWNLKVGFFWGGISAIVIVWAYFRLPEPTGRSFLELDLLFEHRVPARAFAKTDVNAFGDELTKRAAEEAALQARAEHEARVADIDDHSQHSPSEEKGVGEHVEKY